MPENQMRKFVVVEWIGGFMITELELYQKSDHPEKEPYTYLVEATDKWEVFEIVVKERRKDDQ